MRRPWSPASPRQVWFAAADPVAFYEDTVEFGAGTYRIVGYVLSAILVRLGVVADCEGAYPFLALTLLVWLPLTVWLLREQWRSREPAAGARRPGGGGGLLSARRFVAC